MIHKGSVRSLIGKAQKQEISTIFALGGYEHVSRDGCIKLLDALAPHRSIQPDWMRKAYYQVDKKSISQRLFKNGWPSCSLKILPYKELKSGPLGTAFGFYLTDLRQ